MYILALETTGPIGSVAIIDEKGIVKSLSSEETMSHLTKLIPMTEKLLNDQGIKKSQISAVAASIGPGSFTGIRIGVSTARALSQGLNVPAISVLSLESFKENCNGQAIIAPIFNARRGQVYGAIFDEDGKDILKPCPCMLTDVFEKLEKYLEDKQRDLPCGMPITETICFYGDGIDAYEAELEEFKSKIAKEGLSANIKYAEKEVRYQDAKLVAKSALKKYNNNELLGYNQLMPDYMRITEAEQKLKDGTLARERAAKLERFKRSK